MDGSNLNTNTFSDDERALSVDENIMDKLSKEPVKLSESEELIVKLIRKVTDDKLDEKIEDANSKERARCRARGELLSDAVSTLKIQKAQLEKDIEKLVSEFELSSKLVISKIDMVENPKVKDFGFQDPKPDERTYEFGFMNESKRPRKYNIKVVIIGI